MSRENLPMHKALNSTPDRVPTTPQKLERGLRRARERSTEKRRQRAGRRPAQTGTQRLERWQIEAHAELVRQANRLGWQDRTGGEYEGTVAQRKSLCSKLARIQADRAGVGYATWACARRKERAELVARVAA